MNGAHRSAKISSIRFSAAPASVRWDERIAQLGPKHGDFARLLTGSMDMDIDDFTVAHSGVKCSHLSGVKWSHC